MASAAAVNDAKIKNFEAEAAEHRSLARRQIAEAKIMELDLARDAEKRRVELADDKYHHVYRFTGDTSPGATGKCMTQLATWARLEPKCSMEIVFTSPGGEVVSGMALFDFIQQIRAAGHFVTTSTIGMAASMAGILLQAGDLRVMSAESWLLIHQASYAAMGSHGKVEDQVKWVEQVQDHILDIFADRAAGSDAKKPLTRIQIKRRWHRIDWWISAQNALEYGFVDEVR